MLNLDWSLQNPKFASFGTLSLSH